MHCKMRVYQQDKISAIFTLIAGTIKQFSSVFYDLNQTIQKNFNHGQAGESNFVFND